MRGALKTAGAYLFFLVGFWMVALIAVAVGTDIYKIVGKALETNEDPRAFLPAYTDRALAIQIYRDQNRASREYMPFTEWTHRPIRTQTVNVDSAGNRVHRAGQENNAPDARTVGFFGGSAMFGTGAIDDETIPAQFDKITTQYAVTNYADTGFTARQSLAQLMNLTADGDTPKIVVFYDGFNDVRNLCNRAITESTAGTSMERRFRSLMQRGRNVAGIYNVLIAPIMDVFASWKSTITEDYVCAADPMEAHRVADAMVRTWLMARTITESTGGRFFAFLQPNRFTGKPKVDYLPPGITPDAPHEAILMREFDVVYPLIREKLAKTDLAWADLTDAYDGDQPLFVDYSHVNGTGNMIVAERIRDKIEAAD